MMPPVGEPRPDVPTMHESGVTGFDLTAWFGLVTNAGVPRPIIDRLHRETAAILRPGAPREGIKNIDVELTSSTPEQFAQLIGTEFQTWTKVMRESGIKPQ